ncbi:MAG: phosphoglycerate dehydrogenase [Armatimonadetes bacterium]|nr:phosphoglycerate dehydrogenase [Armatimonadota bacterium]
MSDYRILVTDPLADEGLAILEEFGDVEVSPDLSEDELVQAIVGADGLVVRSGTQVTERVIRAADSLQIIARAGVGVDNIDVSAATVCGILVVNCPAGNTVAAAEHTIAMLLAAARNIPQAHAALKDGRWDRKRFMGRQVADKTLGIIGLGRIGWEVARRARGLQMKVLVYDPYLSAQRAKELGTKMCSLEELLQQADFVTIHTALTDETRGMIGAEQLALMKPQAIIINCARGGIISETALYEALTSGEIAGAALDVFEDGSSPNPELVALDNVVVTPHLGASTSEAQVSVAVDAARQVVDVLSGRPPRWPVNMPALSEEIAPGAGSPCPGTQSARLHTD